MQFSAADITAMIDAMGTTATLTDTTPGAGEGDPPVVTTTTVTGVFSTGPREVIRNGAAIFTDEPALLLSATDAAAVTKNSTVITIDDVEYQAYNAVPDGSGFVELDLTRDF